MAKVPDNLKDLIFMRINFIKEKTEIYILAFFIGIVLPLFYFKNSFDPVLIPRTFALTVLVFLLLVVLGYRRYKKISYSFDQKHLYAFYILTTYFIISVISSFFAVNKIEAFGEVTKIGTIILFFYVLLTVLDFNIQHIRIISNGILLMTTIFLVIGIYQFFFKVDLSNVAVKEDYLAYYYTTALNIVSSTLANKNLFSSALFLSLPFTIYTITLFRKWFKIFPIIILILSVIFAVMLVAKAVWVALGTAIIVAFILMLVFVNKNIGISNVHIAYKIGFISIIFTGAVFITFVYTSENKVAIIVKEKITQLTDFENLKEENIKKAERTYSTQQRVMAYYRSFDMFKDNPLLGVGPANWRINLPKYGLYGFGGEIEQGNRNFQRTHSDLLWVLCETGIFSLLLYISIFVLCIFYGVKIFLQDENKEKRLISILFTSTLVGYFILSSFDFPKERITHNVLVYSMFAILLNLNKDSKLKYVKNSIINSIFVFAILFSLIAIKYQRERFKSEIIAVDMYRAYLQKNMNNLIRESRDINDTFYSIIPYSMPVEYYRGLAYSFLKKPDLALKSFTKAYNQAPYQVAVINNYGTLLNLLGKEKEAKKLYMEAVEISPRFVDGNLNLASLLHNEKKFDEAYNLLLNIEHKPSNERYMNVLENVLKQKLYQEYKKTNDPVLKNKIIEVINNKSKLLSYHQQVLKNAGDFEGVLKELNNK